MMNKSTAFFYFLFGLLWGFFLGASLEEAASVTVGKVIFAVVVLVLAFFSRRLESLAHKQHMQKWNDLRNRGKWHFILTRYVLLRGSILVVLLVGPLLPALKYSALIFTVLLLAFVLLAVILSYVGHEEWMMCEEDYQVQVLRQAAEVARQRSALTN
jgi:Mn2+/Fe2+ NRAMP family transporter